MEKLKAHGARYKRTLSAEDDKESPIGRSFYNAYQVGNKIDLEKKLDKWQPDHRAYVLTYPRIDCYLAFASLVSCCDKTRGMPFTFSQFLKSMAQESLPRMRPTTDDQPPTTTNASTSNATSSWSC